MVVIAMTAGKNGFWVWDSFLVSPILVTDGFGFDNRFIFIFSNLI